MSRAVLKTFINLMWVFLGSFIVIKLFYAEWFLAQVENEQILKIGMFIDTHRVARILADTLVSLLTAHFYLCSCKQSWKLKGFQYKLLFVYFLGINICYLWNPSVASVLDLLVLIGFPLLLGCKFKQFIAVFILHHLGQIALLFVRSEPLYLASTNYAVQFILIFDAYAWMILCYLYSNTYKEETLWEKAFSSFSVISPKKLFRKKSQKSTTE